MYLKLVKPSVMVKIRVCLLSGTIYSTVVFIGMEQWSLSVSLWWAHY